MFFLRKPSNEDIRSFLSNQSKFELTYQSVGATAENPPRGYVVDHTRFKLGNGKHVYEAAKLTLGQWDQFNLGWLEIFPKETRIVKGEVVAVVAKLLGVWWLNACRIVSVSDENQEIHRFGFAYGTLPWHVGIGEERFMVEWNQSDDSVWYDILAFSRPNDILSRIGYPFLRRTQKRFGRESAAAMRRAVSQSAP